MDQPLVSSLLAETLKFAASKHGPQRQCDAHATPYLNHVIETWSVLSRVGRIEDLTIVRGAILHDLLEKTRTTPAELERCFGLDVRRLVEELTIDPRLEQHARRALQLKQAAGLSAAAKMIRLCDKIVTLHSLRVDWTLDENREHIDWVERVGRAVGGVNPRLDDAFVDALEKARALLRDASRAPWPPPGMTVAARNDGREFERLLRALQMKLSDVEEVIDIIIPPLDSERRGSDRRKVGPPAGGRAHDPPSGSGRQRSAQPPSSTLPPRKGGRKKKRFADPLFKQLAEPGVRSLDFGWETPRKAIVRIEERPVIRLSKTLAQLLLIIACLRPPGADGFSPFIPWPEVGVELGQLTGRTHSRQDIDVNIDRLQDRLYEHGVNPLLIEEWPQRGVRFRLRRAASDTGSAERQQEVVTQS